MKKKIYFKFGDVIVVVSIILVSMVIFFVNLKVFSSREVEYVSISYSGNVYKYELSVDRKISVKNENYNIEVEIKDRKVRVIYADCPDNTCKHTGVIKNANQIIACIPAKVLIKIVPKGDNINADWISG